MLTLENLAFRWDDWSLSADFSLKTGARVAVLGPSGAGKSTLLALIAGFQHPSSGRILWNGQDISATPPARRPVSMIFQDHNLFPHLTAAQNVGLGLRPDLKLSAAQWADVDNALDRVGLAGMKQRKPAELSGGQAARVPLARALLRRKPLILLDEPFAALGPALRAQMLELVSELAGETGATLLFVSHEPQDAKAIASQVIFVADGKARAPEPTTSIFAAPPPAMRDYLGQ